MGVKISKRYSSYKSQPKVFKLLLNFVPNGPHKTTFGIFEILKIEILMIFFSLSLTWDPMGAKPSKGYSSLKSVLSLFIFFSELSSQWSSQKCCMDCCRAHENKICPSSVVCRASVRRRPSVAWTISEVAALISLKF